MKILIVGSDTNSILFAQYVKAQHPEHDLYLSSEDVRENSAYTAINIRENDIAGIIDFVKYNAIEFTVVFSTIAIVNGIADVFRKEEFPIFAPLSESAKITFFSSIAKKIMYKLKINTPRFGIFDRESVALEYASSAKFPIAILNDFILSKKEYQICNSFQKAKLQIQKMFEDDNEKIIIENYMESDPIYIYFITDGYNVLPFIALDRNFQENYTSTSAPSKKITDDIIISILQNVIYPLIDDIAKFSGNYTGVMGIKIKLENNSFYVLDFYNGFKGNDFQTILSIFNEDILDVMYSAANGALCDKYHYLNFKNLYSYTIETDEKNIDYDKYEEDDFTESIHNGKHVFTSLGRTLNSAKTKLLEYLQGFVEEDLYKEIEKSELKEDTVH
ncbi:hypothetical protein II906_02845 [bacterium]|nr:hypothetical protein [bacterium]